MSLSVSPLKGDLALNEKTVTVATVGPALRQELAARKEKDMLVIIRADKGVSYGQVQELMDTAKKFGAQRIAIATQQDQEKVK